MAQKFIIIVLRVHFQKFSRDEKKTVMTNHYKPGRKHNNIICVC